MGYKRIMGAERSVSMLIHTCVSWAPVIYASGRSSSGASRPSVMNLSRQLSPGVSWSAVMIAP